MRSKTPERRRNPRPRLRQDTGDTDSKTVFPRPNLLHLLLQSRLLHHRRRLAPLPVLHRPRLLHLLQHVQHHHHNLLLLPLLLRRLLLRRRRRLSAEVAHHQPRQLLRFVRLDLHR